MEKNFVLRKIFELTSFIFPLVNLQASSQLTIHQIFYFQALNFMESD